MSNYIILYIDGYEVMNMNNAINSYKITSIKLHSIKN